MSDNTATFAESSTQEGVAETTELWELVRIAEEEGFVREPMELRRLFAEQEHWLDAAALRTLAKLAERAELRLAAAWCSRESQRLSSAPRFFQRFRSLFEAKSPVLRQVVHDDSADMFGASADQPEASTNGRYDDKAPGRNR